MANRFSTLHIGSNGRSNYNGGFLSLHKRDQHRADVDLLHVLTFDQVGQNQESLNEASDAFNLDRTMARHRLTGDMLSFGLGTYDLPFGRAGARPQLGEQADRRWNVSGV